MAIEEKRGCGYRQVGGIYLVGDGLAIGCDRLPFPLGACPACGAGIHFTRSITEIDAIQLFGPHDSAPRGRRVISHAPFENLEGLLRWSSQKGIDHALFQKVTGVKDLTNANVNVRKAHERIDDYLHSKCHCPVRPCQVCDPIDEPAYLMMVGEKFYPTPQDFRNEVHRMGVSKRIPFLPKHLKLGETVIYLAHRKAVKVDVASTEEEDEGRLVKGQRKDDGLGVFMAFVPRAAEMPVREGDLKGKGSGNLKKSLLRRGITPVPIPDNDKDHGKVTKPAKPRRKKQ